MIKNYLINSITLFVICMATMLLSQLIPPFHIDLQWPDSVIICAITAFMLGGVVTWMQKRGWW